jgi:hypothetical protein
VTQAYHVFAHRQDGYSGAIAATAEGLPAGVTARPLTIGPGARWGVLVLDVAPGAAPATSAFAVKLTGTDGAGKALVRAARPASVTWGTPQPDQNVPVLAKLDQALVIAVRAEKAAFGIKADLAGAVVKPATGKEEKVAGPIIVMKQGDKATVPVKVDWTVAEKPNVTLTAEPLAQNPQNQPVTAQIAGQPTKDKPEVPVTLDAKANAAPGLYTLVFRGTAQVPFGKDPMAKQKANVPAEGFSTPVQVLVVPTAVAKLTPGQLKSGVLKLGDTNELPIKVEWLNDFAGEVKLTVKLPPELTGVTAQNATIAAGADAATVVFKAAADAKPGSSQNVVVTATATYAGKYTVTQELKVSITVAK